MSWKQITDDYGKDEAIQRLQAGLIKMRKDAEAWKKGLKLYQFLKVEEEMKMGRGGNQAMTGCSSGTTAEEQGATLARAMKSVQAADEDFFDAAWLGKDKKNASIEDWQLTESEALDAASQHESETDMAVFLAELGVAGSSAPGKRRRVEDASPEAWKKAKPSKDSNKTQKPSKACDKAKASEACNKAKKFEEKLQKFNKNVDQLSSCDMGEAKRNTRKMVSLLAGEIKTTREMAKTHAQHKGLKQSLQKLEKLHGEVEQAMVDEKKDKALMALLVKAAQFLKTHKRILQSAEA